LWVIHKNTKIYILNKNRYKFTNYNKEDGEIYEFIEKLDLKAMELIELNDIK
jgi:hypothetical protein